MNVVALGVVEGMQLELRNPSLTEFAVGFVMMERNYTFSGPGVGGQVPFYPQIGGVAIVVVEPSTVQPFPADSFQSFSDPQVPGSFEPYLGSGTVGFDIVIDAPLSFSFSNPEFPQPPLDVSLLRDGSASVAILVSYVPEPAGLSALAAVFTALISFARRGPRTRAN